MSAKKLCGTSKRRLVNEEIGRKKIKTIETEENNVLEEIECVDLKPQIHIDIQQQEQVIKLKSDIDVENQIKKDSPNENSNEKYGNEEEHQIHNSSSKENENEKRQCYKSNENQNVCGSCVNLQKQFTEVKDIILRLECLQAEQNILLRKIEKKFYPETSRADGTDFGLPIDDKEKLHEIEEKLAENSYKKKFIEYVKELKGKQSLTKLFPHILADKCANDFNWKGVKGKQSIQIFKNILDCLFDVFKNPKFGKIDFQIQVTESLKNANLRIIKKNWKTKHTTSS